MAEPVKEEVLKKAEELLKAYPLCDRCLGRQFGWLSTDTSNEERGNAIKLVLSMIADEYLKSGKKKQGEDLIQTLASNGMFGPAAKCAEKHAKKIVPKDCCLLCSIDSKNIFDSIPDIMEKALKATKNIEFATFLVGSVPPPDLAELEDEIKASHKLLYGETLRSDFNRELGKKLQIAFKKQVEFGRPDIVVVYDMKQDKIKMQINPIFISGNYRKLAKGIPQSRWDCSHCGGKGCELCDNTGRKYPDSIAEYIGIPIQEEAKGTKFKFHAAGREDIDALMLGSGRPFVVEVSEPRTRNLDLTNVENTINQEAAGKVEVSNLQASNRSHAQELKNQASENVKEYRTIIQTMENVSDDSLAKAEEDLSGIQIEQQTPKRVVHRRSDLVRKKSVFEVRLSRKGDRLLEGFFKVQGGTYVKELISGDDGRTNPSLSKVLGIDCICIELTVTAIHSLESHHNA